MTEQSQTRYRPGIHVYLYFWVALLILGIVPALLISGAVFDSENVTEGIVFFAVLLAAFQLLFWYARRRCSTPDLSGWDGLVLIAAYMTIGIGGTSLFIVVPCVIIAVLGMTGIALWSVFDSDGESAARRFRAMVIWFGRHRMYQ